MKVRKFENLAQLNEHLNSVNLNEIVEAQRVKITNDGIYHFDSLGLQLFVNAVLKAVMLEEGDEASG